MIRRNLKLWRPRLDSLNASLDLGPHVKNSIKDSLIVAAEIVPRDWLYTSGHRQYEYYNCVIDRAIENVKITLDLYIGPLKMWPLHWFYKSGKRKCEYYVGFIHRATENMNITLVLYIGPPSMWTLHWFCRSGNRNSEQTSGFIKKTSPGNQCDLRSRGLGLQYSPE